MKTPLLVRTCLGMRCHIESLNLISYVVLYRLPRSLFNPHALCRVSEWIEARICQKVIEYLSLGGN